LGLIQRFAQLLQAVDSVAIPEQVHHFWREDITIDFSRIRRLAQRDGGLD
jgi:hypothetical protein